MTDILYIALTLLFFAASYGLVALCRQLMEDRQ